MECLYFFQAYYRHLEEKFLLNYVSNYFAFDIHITTFYNIVNGYIYLIVRIEKQYFKIFFGALAWIHL